MNKNYTNDELENLEKEMTSQKIRMYILTMTNLMFLITFVMFGFKMLHTMSNSSIPPLGAVILMLTAPLIHMSAWRTARDETFENIKNINDEMVRILERELQNEKDRFEKEKDKLEQLKHERELLKQLQIYTDENKDDNK